MSDESKQSFWKLDKLTGSTFWDADRVWLIAYTALWALAFAVVGALEIAGNQ